MRLTFSGEMADAFLASNCTSKTNIWHPKDKGLAGV